jgi:hypothetical protein
MLKVASVAQNRAGGSRTPTSLGWAAFDVFKLTVEGNVDLTSGCFKLPVKQSAMPDPSKTVVLPPPIGECGDIQVCIRVVHGERAEEASRVLVDPEFHAGTVAINYLVQGCPALTSLFLHLTAARYQLLQ